MLNKAKTKSADIIKEIKSKLPTNFQLETPDNNTYILDGSEYYLAVSIKDDVIHLIIAFEKSTLDGFRNTNSVQVDSTKVDSSKVVVDSTRNTNY